VSKPPEGVRVSIMGREYSVACSEGQQNALSQAAVYLDKKMRDIQRSGKVIGLEKCAVMAALNLAHELLASRTRSGESERIGAMVFNLLDKIDVAMQEQKQLSL
jgi:cell division protein ZapA